MAQTEKAKHKRYGAAGGFEGRLRKVMERFAVQDYDWNYDRWGAWVSFRLKDELYRFEHTVDKARSHGIHIHFGTDCFAEIVLCMEDLVRMVERGVYGVQTWVAGMRVLPQAFETPACFTALGFPEVPATVEDVEARFRSLASKVHAEAGGDQEAMGTLTAAAEEATSYFAHKKDDTLKP